MKRFLIAGFMSILLIVSRAEAELNIVTTTPDFASIAEEIGGDRVEVTSLARGIQDPHFVDAKPSFIRLLNQADILIEGGAGLEAGWLPPLLENARNGKIQMGRPGRIVASTAIRLLEVPTRLIDRSQGDVHVLGNPHFMLDPENGKFLAEQITAALCRLDAGSCESFKKNFSEFEQGLNHKMADWTRNMAAYRGTKILTYHDSWPYFAERFGLNVVGHLEPKPGIPPSPGHLESLIDLIGREKVKILIMEPYFSDKAPKFLAQRTGIEVLVLHPSISPEAGINTYFDIFDQDIARLTGVLKKEWNK